jgi:hypothetical protein
MRYAMTLGRKRHELVSAAGVIGSFWIFDPSVNQVELSGLEPLISCMPCRPISSAPIAGSLVPAREATCGVWLGPGLAARVWGRSHWACHWLSGSPRR